MGGTAVRMLEIGGGKIELISSLLKFGERTKRVQDETVYMPSPTTMNSKGQTVIHSDEELLNAFEEINK